MSVKLKKICIGTANFGEKYGINNKIFPNNERKELFELLKKKKIFFIDTAIIYKNSEKIIGKYQSKKFNIITKIKINKKNNLRQHIINEINQSLIRLNTNSLYGVLIHNPRILENQQIRKKIFSAFKYLKTKGLVKNFGLSIYDPREFLLYNKLYNFKILQAPYNIFDRRILEKKYLNIIKKKKILLFARSIFLKGKYKKKEENYNKIFQFNNFYKWLKKNKKDYYEVCIRFVISNPNIYKIIIGVSSLRQLKKIINYINLGPIDLPELFKINKVKLIDPRKW